MTSTPMRWRRTRRVGFVAAGLTVWAALLTVPTGPALAQTLSLDLGQGGGVAERALQIGRASCRERVLPTV